MRVYVETNFLLEVAYDQGQADACKALLALADQGKITLVIPAFSLVEAAETWRQQGGKIRAFSEQTQVPTALSRFPWLGEALGAFRKGIITEVAATGQRLEAVTGRLLGVAEIVSLDAEVLRESTRLADCRLYPPDLTVLASALVWMQRKREEGPSVFLNLNKNDFDVEPVKQRLAECQSQLFYSFTGGLAYVEKNLAP